MLIQPERTNEEQLTRAVLRLSGNAWGLACGVLCGLGLFVATIWLVIKGGDPVGPHLRLLAQYLIGYRVTVKGAFIGLAWGFVLGYLAGWLVAWIYNRIISLRQR
ncbi:MAG: hypothetical protein N3B01_02100 [Verrucomicrobiae bacterium]|nr:hypothetical protein [Verrucomicrobiae bacterium]